MGKIDEDDIRRVREATDLVAIVAEHVILKQKGREFWGCCPFHNEKTPSFKVDPASQFYHCFGCGEGGDVYKFLMKTEDMDFPDAVRYLAGRAGIDIVEEKGGLPSGRRSRLIAVCDETADFYHRQLMRGRDSDAQRARSYLSKRGLGGEIPKLWELGYAPGNGKLSKYLTTKGFRREEIIDANVGLLSDSGTLRDRFYDRVMFPIHDLQGRTIAFGGRIIGPGEPKYLNTSNSPLFHKRENLYAIDRAKAAITSTGTAVVVEGYTDVIAMFSVGFTNTVATLGTALTPQHVKLLTRYAKKVIYLFDGDAAGLRAADRASELIGQIITPEAGKNRVDLMVAVLPDGKDPAEYCEVAGKAGVESVLASAKPLLRFAIDRKLETEDLSSPEQRFRALQNAVQLLVPVRGSLLAADYINYLADGFATDYQTVKTALDTAKEPLRRPDDVLDDTADGHGGRRAAHGYQTGGSLHDTAHDRTEARLKTDDAQARLERELLALYAQQPSARSKLKGSFTTTSWSSELHKVIADQLILRADTEAPAATMAALATSVPESASLLGGNMVSYQDADELERGAEFLLTSLKEEILERGIRKGNAQLRKPDEMSAEAYDKLFREVSTKQKELNDLKKRRPSVGL